MRYRGKQMKLSNRQRGAVKILLAGVALLGLALPARAEDRAIKSRVTPVYPEIAKRMKIAGAVKLEVKVDAAGSVTEVKTISGNHMLSVAAEDAVKKWKFAAGDGVSTTNIEIQFAIP